MGGTSWCDMSYASYSASVASTPRASLFKATAAAPAMVAKAISIRESRDSAANPESTPIILASDVTGSMGLLAEQILKRDLGVIMGEIYKRKPVSNPHIMGIALGDGSPEGSGFVDNYPIQATQFESEVVAITSQLEKLFLEGGGGGNGGESYAYAWMFAELKCVCDSFIKRNKKGYLFSIGDESPIMSISRQELKKWFDESDIAPVDNIKTLLERVQKNWHVFHIMTNPVVSSQNVVKDWTNLLGTNAIKLQDNKLLGEVIISIMQVNEGVDKKTVASSWDGSTNLVVADAIKDLAGAGASTGSAGSVMKFS